MIASACQALSIPFQSEWRPALQAHLDLLRRWAPRMNLVASSTLPNAELRHVVDSLALLKLECVRTSVGSAIDIGSGAGFPGIPLAAACPDTDWTLLEPRKKRGVFLTQAILAARLTNVRWHEGRLPDPDLAGAFSLAVSRATFAPEALIEAARPLLTTGGKVVVMAAHDPGLTSNDVTLVEAVSFELDGDPRWVGAYLPS